MVEELRPNLFRWESRHPAWEADPEPGSPADWPPEVGSVAYAAPERLVFIDPLVTQDAWGAIDALVERHGLPVTVLKTMRFHTRSRAELVERYGAERPKIGEAALAGVETIPIDGFDETMVWLPEPRALVPGDRLLGAEGGGLRTCPESWLSYIDGSPREDALREALRPLLELPIELVLVSHGEPVLHDARGALERALC